MIGAVNMDFVLSCELILYVKVLVHVRTRTGTSSFRRSINRTGMNLHVSSHISGTGNRNAVQVYAGCPQINKGCFLHAAHCLLA